MKALSYADRSIVEKLVARKDSGRDQRLSFLANRFNKDVAKFVKISVMLSSKRHEKRKNDRFCDSIGTVDKDLMRDILTHLKVFHHQNNYQRATNK